MYSNNSFPNNFLSDDSVPTNINSNSNEGTSSNHHQQNELNESLDLTHDYISNQIVVSSNYLSNELLHHQLSKKMDVVGYQQPKSQDHQNLLIYTDSSSPSSTALIQPPLLNLTPKYTVEYQAALNEDGQHMIIPNDDSDKSDCEDFMSTKHVKQSLPHKKRIAKKLNSNQSYYSIIIPGAEETRGVVSSASFECNICGMCFIDQLQFFVHLKEHYEPPVQKESDKKTEEDLQVHVKELAYKDEFNEFSDPEDVMEDLRKEVEKVVETIAENEPQWNYQVSEIESQNDEHQADLQIYTENCIDPNYDEIADTHDQDSSEVIEEQHAEDVRYDSEDDEDDKPLEQVRQTLRLSTHANIDCKKLNSDVDKEDVELTECLKKIHNFKCSYDLCGKAFNSRTALGYHLKTHSVERRYVCDQCGKKFLTNGALKVHQRLHSDTRPYQCIFPDCGKSFRQWGDLRYHETSIHSNKKDHVCEFCAKAFARKYSLVIHRRIHTGERNYKCQDCGKCFRASSYLLNHKRIHTGEKPYVCTTLSCQKKFRVVGDLKRHMKIHERSKNPSPKDKKASTSIKKDAVNECVDLSFSKVDEAKTSLSTSKSDGFSSTRKGKKLSKHKKK